MPRNLAALAARPRFDEDDPVPTIWPAPDMSVLLAGRRPPPALPPAMFGPVWPLLCDLAAGAGAPVDYVAGGYIATAASLIGGKRRVRPYPQGDWAEPCIIWLGLVGDPSSNKSPALDRATYPLRGMEKEGAEAHADALLGWQTDCERAKLEKAAWQAAVKKAQEEGLPSPRMTADAAEPPMPQRRRLMVQDSTPEKMAEILAGNPAGTLHLRDELAGWLTSFDRYSPGGREFWLEAFGGRPYVIDRKSNPEPVSVEFNGVSVVGGIQPEKLADALFGRGKPDDGLVARFLWTWPDRPPFRRPRTTIDRSILRDVYSRLDGLAWGVGEDGRNAPITLPLSDAAADAFEAFERHNADASDEAFGLFKSFCGKLPGIVLRLALVAELGRWAFEGGPEPQEVSLPTLETVADWAEEYAKPMALRVFGDAALPEVERNAARIAQHILKRRHRRINARDLYHKEKLPGLREAEPVNSALGFLVEAEWLRPDPSRQGDTKGRARADYIVNPALLEASDGQVE
jgi:hypothetical protein